MSLLGDIIIAGIKGLLVEIFTETRMVNYHLLTAEYDMKPI